MEELRAKGLCRKLGPLEQLLTARKLHDFYNNFSLIGTYNLDLTPAIIFSALRKLLLSHTLLLTNYSSETNEIFPLKRLLFGDVVKFEERDSFDASDFCEELENYRFNLDSDEPIFRILVINKRILAVTFEHAYTDGGSGTNFHDIFIKLANELTDEEMNLIINDSSVLFDLSQDLDKMAKLPLCTEETIQSKPDYAHQIKSYVKSRLPDYLKYYVNDHNYAITPKTDIDGNTLTKWPGVKATLTHKTYYSVSNYTPEQVKKLISLARSKKMTLTPIIQILLLRTLVDFKAIKNDEEAAYYVNAMIACNLRRFVAPEDQEMAAIGARVYPGIFVNPPVLDLEKSVTDESLFWDICKRASETVVSTTTDPKVLMVHYNGCVTNYDTESPEKMKKAVYNGYLKTQCPSTKFSNLGYIKSGDGKFKIEDMLFSQSIGVNGASYVTNIVSSEKSGMNLGVCCLGELFNDDKGSFLKHCEQFKKEILKLIDE